MRMLFLPTEHGDFRIRAFRDPSNGKEHCLLYLGDLSEGTPWFDSLGVSHRRRLWFAAL